MLVIALSLFFVVVTIILGAGLKTGRIVCGGRFLKMLYVDRRTRPVLFWMVVAVHVVILVNILWVVFAPLDFGGWRLFP